MIADEIVLLVESQLLVAVGGKAVRAVRVIVRLARGPVVVKGETRVGAAATGLKDIFRGVQRC